ncbi:hypothetical protein ACG3RN_23175 [Pseudomonas aeruginosa]
MKPAIKRACLLGTALFSLCASAAQAAGVLVGTWDLRGNGQLAAVYRDGANLQVVEGGSTRNYSFGNVVWSVSAPPIPTASPARKSWSRPVPTW